VSEIARVLIATAAGITATYGAPYNLPACILILWLLQDRAKWMASFERQVGKTVVAATRDLTKNRKFVGAAVHSFAKSKMNTPQGTFFVTVEEQHNPQVIDL